MILSLVLVLIRAVVVVAVSATDFYLGDKHVRTLTTDNFAKLVEKSTVSTTSFSLPGASTGCGRYPSW